jgi:hypothetical protein
VEGFSAGLFLCEFSLLVSFSLDYAASGLLFGGKPSWRWPAASGVVIALEARRNASLPCRQAFFPGKITPSRKNPVLLFAFFFLESADAPQ